MLIRNFGPYFILFSSLILATTTMPVLSIWNFVDYRRYGAFPEEDHISMAYILGGDFMSRLMFMQHFKSILKYSDHYFRLHFIVDDGYRSDMKDMMTSWNISNCEWFMHNLTEYSERVKWIPNSHYSKYYGLTKLLIPEIMGENVGKVMFMDIDIIFQSDIYYLWKTFRDFNNSQSLGMVENLSDWYLNKDGKKSVWPALGRGFNSGIIMMDLDKLRERDWKNKWKEVANKYLKIHAKTTMSDQDIFNAYAYEHPDEIKTLPCEYNYQLGAITKSKELCNETPLALHFNSQNKTVRRDYMLYNEIRKEVEGIDGSELRRRRSLKHQSIEEETSQMKICETYLPLENYRILPNSLGRMKKKAELCMVTQFSKDRLSSFIASSKVWNFPISAAVYGKDKDLVEIAKAVKLLNRRDITLHMVFEEFNEESSKSENVYPINFLRNIALNYSNCVNVLLVDVDFMIFGDIKQLAIQSKSLKEKEVLVVPAFEFTNENVTELRNFPKTKKDVAMDYFNGTVRVFRQIMWPSAHNATNVTEWIASDDVYTVNYHKNYEPYFIIRKDNCPLYDPRFGGFGWNKMTHVLQLRMMNFKFQVSPSAFMIHQNHNISKSLYRWRHDARYKTCLHMLKKEFVEDTAKKLGIQLK